jgi:hypothetical protein
MKKVALTDPKTSNACKYEEISSDLPARLFEE